LLQKPLKDMMNAEWLIEVDSAENADKNWTPYIEICQNLTSEMVTHSVTYLQVEQNGKVAEGQSSEDKSGQATSEKVSNTQANHSEIRPIVTTSRASKKAKMSGRSCKMS
jgi:hypothetical protein